MDREWFLGAFAVAAVVGLLITRWIIRRVGAWQLLREAEEDRWARLYVLGAVVVLLWVATAVVGQLISSTASATTQVLISSGNFLESPRQYLFSISAGISIGINFGFALGLIRFVLRVVREVGDGDSSEGGEVDWSRPTESDAGTSEGGDAEWARPAGE
jgi:hypothetical protein